MSDDFDGIGPLKEAEFKKHRQKAKMASIVKFITTADAKKLKEDLDSKGVVSVPLDDGSFFSLTHEHVIFEIQHRSGPVK